MELNSSSPTKTDSVEPSFDNKLDEFNKLYNEFSVFVHNCISEDDIVLNTESKLKNLYYFCKNLLQHVHETVKCNIDYCLETNFILLNDIKFTQVWETLEDDNRQKLWKYLHSLYVVSMSTGLVENLVDKKFGKSTSHSQMKENITNYVDLIQNIITFRDQTTSSENQSTSQTDFMENSAIGQLAKEISSEIDTTQFEGIENPADLMGKLFSGGENGGLMNLMKNVTDKLTSKIDSGELDTNTLVQEAQGMLGGLGGAGGEGMPDLGSLMGMMGLAGGGSGGNPLAQMMNMMGGLNGGGKSRGKSRKVKRRLKKKMMKKKKKKRQ